MAEQQTTPSFLDLLRQRTASNLQNEGLQRLSEFGAGMAASGSPNFFTMLSAGARAQAEGDRSRMEELRRIAEAERQAAEQQSQEQYRRDQIEIERQRRAIEERRLAADIERGNRPEPGTIVGTQEGTGFAVRMNRDGTTTVLEGIFPTQALRNAPRPLSQAQIANIRQQAIRLANTDVGIVEGVAPTPAQITRRDELVDRYVRDSLNAAAAGLLNIQGGGAGTATTGGAGAPAGTQPSQTLTYPRTP
jgi:hypothetical protein